MYILIDNKLRKVFYNKIDGGYVKINNKKINIAPVYLNMMINSNINFRVSDVGI